jgi:hypothetical protein
VWRARQVWQLRCIANRAGRLSNPAIVRSLEGVAEVPGAIGDAPQLPHPTRTPHREPPSQLQHVATTVPASDNGDPITGLIDASCKFTV